MSLYGDLAELSIHPIPGREVARRFVPSGGGGKSAARRGLALVMLCLLACPARAQDDSERMEQFLARLGLVDLQAAYLEQTLAGPVDPQRQQQLARRLADLYAERLMAAADDKAQYDDTLRRITPLLERYPQANTTSLQVMLLQADYNRAESLIASWMSEPQETTARGEAQQILARITPQLVAHQRELNQHVDELITQIDELTDGDLLQSRELELRRVQGIAARATYFAAWSNYYLGLISEAAAGGEPYTTARGIFLRLLGLDDPLPDDLAAEWLGLESIWRARALIGLGLSLAACGDVEGAGRCFDVLEDPGVPSEVRDQAPYWYMRALLGAQQWDRADTYARQKINYYQPPPTQGRVSLCVALVREGYGASTARNDSRRKLGDLGLVGLARLGQLAAINTLIEKYQIRPDASSGFILQWAAGQQRFAAAESSKAASDYETAAQTLLKALRAPEANTLAGPAARCRYTLGWCYFRLDRLEEAAREFSNAFPGLLESKDDLAVESAWMAFAAYRKLAESEPRFVSRAADAQKRLEQNFSEHPYSQRASYEMTKLQEKTDPETMIAQLEAIAPGDENYALARYDLCLLLHRLWKGQRDDPQKANKRLTELRTAVETYLATVSNQDDALRQFKVCLLAADAALSKSAPQPDIAEAMLTRAARFASALPDAHPQVVEYHYRWLQWAAATGDAAQRRQQAQWIADHAEGSPYEQAALVIVANAIDRQLSNASSSDQETLSRQAYSVYRRLADVLGSSPEKLSASKNARIAASRLAHYAVQIGQPAEAAGILEQLLAIQPRDRQYLQRAAQAHTEAGQHAQALPHFRALLAGLPSDSEEWYQAKYGQLVALSHTDKEQARKVYRQFELLHPERGGDAWKAKFSDLARNW